MAHSATTSRILETERLIIRELAFADAPFVLELLNEPDFHRYIGRQGRA
ncbi:MAG: hypothetical protein WDM96_19320 [Lacunisphaera sp.]